MPQAAGLAIGYMIALMYVVPKVMKFAGRLIGNSKNRKLPQAQYNATYSGTAEAARLIYGTVIVGGMYTLPPFCTRNDGKYLHILFSICLGEIEGFEAFYFDKETILATDCTAVTGTADDGKVNAGKYNNRASFRGYRGTSTQTADYILTTEYPSTLTSDFRGRGIAYVAVSLWSSKVYNGQVPQFTCKVKGRLIYDPRTGLVGSTASNNPALVWRDYMVNEVGFPSSAIDDTLVTAAANICDQLVDIPPGPSTQQKRYTCDVMLNCADDWEDNVRIILQAMQGTAVYRDGVWRLYAGAWDTPVDTIEVSDWAREMTVRISAPMEERWNNVQAFYYDADRRYQRVPAYMRRNTTYESDDGERIPLELEVQGATNEYHAQRVAEFELRKSRNQLTVRGVLRPEFLKLATWDTVYVTDADYGWSSKSFRVTQMEMTQDGNVAVELVEEGSATWTDLARSEYSTATTWLTIDPGASLPEERTGLTITPQPGSITFSWNVSSETLPGEMTRILEAAVSSNATAASEIWRGSATGVNLTFSSVATKAYWVQGVVGSYTGPYTPNTFGTYAAAQSGGAGSPGNDGVSIALTLPAVTLPASTNGNVANYAPAAGTFEVWKAGVNVTSYATFDVASAAGCTGTVNSGHGTPWASNSKGAYRVTAVTSAIGELQMTAVYSGTTYARKFVVSKASDGAAGADGLSAELTMVNATIACDAAGVPKSGAFNNAKGYCRVWAGAVEITNSCVFTNSRYGVTGTVNSAADAPVTGSKGYYVASAVDSDATYMLITAAFSTQSITKQFSLNKSYDGAASSYAEDTTFTNVTSTAYGTTGQAGVIEIAVGPSGYITVSLTGGYKGSTTSNGDTMNINAKIQYRDKAVGGAYTDVTGAVGSGGTAEYTDSWLPSNITISPTSMAAPSSLAIYEFQAVMLKYGTGGTGTWMGTPKLSAQWRP